MTKFIVLTNLFLSGLNASVQAVPHLRELTSQAEAIAVGNLVSSTSLKLTEPSPGLALSRVTAELKLTRIIAGALVRGDQIAVRWNQSGAGSNSLPKGDFGIWFLKREAPNSWAPVAFVAQPRGLDDVRLVGSSQISPGFEYDSTAPVLDRVLLETLSAASVDSDNRFSYLHWGAFDGLNVGIMEKFYRTLLASPISDRHTKGLAGLIRLSRGDGLSTFERELPGLIDNLNMILFSLASSFRNGDSASVSALGRLASNASALSVRKGAAQTLAYIHNEQCLPHLASLLDSGELDLEVLGAAGLAMFANGVRVVGKGGNINFSPSGAAGPYRSDETIQNFTLDSETVRKDRTRYIGFWRSWWNVNRAALTAAQQ